MLTVGTKAPDFTLQNPAGENISLSNYLGRKIVVYFYPKDHTPGCTRQACAFRDTYDGFSQKDIIVIGISGDAIDAHKQFVADYELPFILLADPNHQAINDFGVWVEKTNFGNTYMGISRSTFIIDEKGIVEKVFKKANPDTNAQDILKYLDKQK